MRYTIFDPTGNVTALVEDPVAESRQADVARSIMEAHPEVEQVGFVTSDAGGTSTPRLRMAGGEFCGNATMCAAALLAQRGVDGSRPHGSPDDARPGTASLLIRVSGAKDLIEVRLTHTGEDGNGVWEGAVRMPPARSMESVTLSWGGVDSEVPVVFMAGITHAIVERDSPLSWLAAAPREAEGAVRAWCASLDADGLGLMFLGEDAGGRTLTPLVFVPGADTCFWESSCASGTSACGIYEAGRTGSAVELSLREPGGILRVNSAPGGPTWLYGHVREVSRHELP